MNCVVLSELCCSTYCFVLIVLFYVLFVCKCVLPPGVNPIAVKYIISCQYYIISYSIVSKSFQIRYILMKFILFTYCVRIYTCICEVSISNLSRDIGYPEIILVSRVPPGKWWDNTLISPRLLNSNLFQIHHSPVVLTRTLYILGHRQRRKKKQHIVLHNIGWSYIWYRCEDKRYILSQTTRNYPN